jgi:hypothetical protein
MKKDTIETIVFKREQLYQEVWSIPILQLAKKYSISDVGLAKICRKMKIPRPPRGYWAKRSFGQPTKIPILRPAAADTPDEISVDRNTQHLAKIHDGRRLQTPTIAIERQKIRHLKAALHKMETARRAREYLEAMRLLPNANEPDQVEWLAWVARYADQIDPTSN